MSKFLQDIYDIRIKPDLPRGPVPRRLCEWKGCTAPAPHRAPKSRDRLREFHWFCLDHVREYNARWNFFEGMSERDIEHYIHNNVGGQRPTWKMGAGKSGAFRAGAWTAFRNDPFGVFDDMPGFAHAGAQQQQPTPWTPRLPAATRRALDALELDETASFEDIKLRYKVLVKRYHPDANGGDRKSEDRLRRVIQAYAHLKACAQKGRWPAP